MDAIAHDDIRLERFRQSNARTNVLRGRTIWADKLVADAPTETETPIEGPGPLFTLCLYGLLMWPAIWGVMRLFAWLRGWL